MCDKKQGLTKEDANKALDNINMWINNCDTKTSIVLGFYATIITICLSTDFVDVQADIFSYFFSDITFIKIIYLIIHGCSIISFVIGIVELLVVIVPRIILKTNSKENFNSVLFYGSIAKNMPQYSDYKNKIEEITQDKKILDDLLFQIHSAALICNKKFFHQKIGLLLTTISVIIFFITTVVGMFLV